MEENCNFIHQKKITGIVNLHRYELHEFLLLNYRILFSTKEGSLKLDPDLQNMHSDPQPSCGQINGDFLLGNFVKRIYIFFLSTFGPTVRGSNVIILFLCLETIF